MFDAVSVRTTVQVEELVAWTEKCREILEVTGQISLETPVAADATAESEAAAPAAPATTVKRTNSRKN